MRKPDKTLIFGSGPQQAPAFPPVSQRAPVSLGAPVSRPLEKQWFNEPPSLPAEPEPVAEPLRPVGDDLIAERRGFIPRSPERGLAFAAVALALIGVAGAGTYFFFGLNGETAHQEETSKTTLTSAEMPTTEQPAATPAPPTPTPAPAATPADLPWVPPVVDAVKSPGLKAQVTSPQVLPTERATAPQAPNPSFNTVKTVPTAKQIPANDQQAADDARAAAGFLPSTTPSPNENSVTPPPIQRAPASAGDSDVTTHMEPSDDDNTMHNPSGEPALPQTIKQ